MQAVENTLLFAVTFPKMGLFGKVTSLRHQALSYPYRRFRTLRLEPYRDVVLSPTPHMELAIRAAGVLRTLSSSR